MDAHHPNIAIVGAGAVGGYYGARLAEAGYPVQFLVRGDYDAIRAKGWRIKSCDGDFAIAPQRVSVHRTPATLASADWVIVTLKATENDSIPAWVRPLLKPTTAILTLQNGLGNEEFLAGHFGAERIVGGLVFACIVRTGPGEIFHSDHGHIHVGSFLSDQKAKAIEIAGILSSAHIRTTVLDELADGRWEKLLWNIPFNGLGAALDLSTDRLVGHPNSLALVRGIMEEVRAAAVAVGTTLDNSLIEKKLRETQSMGPYRTSMQIDRELGRPMEVEAILGNPFRAARSAGIPTPRLEMLYRMLLTVDARRPEILARNQIPPPDGRGS